jgi:oxygen-independent coproporphyrinogen-3 oxidase
MEPIDYITDAANRLQLLDVPELQNAGLIPKDNLYYPTIYYPPIPMYGKSDEASLLAGLHYDESRYASAYIHIPFCRSRCLYCHWMVNVGCSDGEIDDYLECLTEEMALWKKKLGVKEFSPRSILIGGGTPTVLSPKQTIKLFNGLKSELNLDKCAQITCETEPGTVLGASGIEKLQTLKDQGVHRISLGIQALDDRSLKDMGRLHSASDALRAIEQVRKVGFPSLSIDLIYGYPGCTPEKWLATLQAALSAGIDAFQLYRLRIVPHGDKVGAVKGKFDKNPESFPTVDEIYVMKQLGTLIADQAGLKETSRRLFTKGPAHDSQYLKDHTDRLADVIGFGASSWSNMQGRFYLNTGESLARYAAFIREGILPINRGKIKTEDDVRRWAITLPLKHSGLSKKLFRRVTGVSVRGAFPRQIDNLKKYDLLEEDEDSLRLTARGRFFADEVITQFYHPSYLPFPRSSYAEGDLDPFSHNLS